MDADQRKIRQVTFDLFKTYPLTQAIFTRHGGVSPAPWASLNQGGTVGDERSNVIENRRRCFEVVGRQVESIFDVWQVHSAEVVCADAPRPLEAPHEQADAIITNRPEITLFMRFADCVPIFLFDPKKQVISLIHAGWKGTLNGLVRKTVQILEQRYRCLAQDILAGIGPSICLEHYPVGPEVIEKTRIALGAQAEEVLQEKNGVIHLDLWQANLLNLHSAGVEKVEVSRICTACDVKDWFSHRAEDGRTGRFGALLALPG